VRISADLQQHLAWLHDDDRQLGFDRVYLHDVGMNQDEFIDAFSEHVWPRVAQVQVDSSV
jgi:coenzyme F420-dependent glucose-6-phosphate dehydrogenase